MSKSNNNDNKTRRWKETTKLMRKEALYKRSLLSFLFRHYRHHHDYLNSYVASERERQGVDGIKRKLNGRERSQLQHNFFLFLLHSPACMNKSLCTRSSRKWTYVRKPKATTANATADDDVFPYGMKVQVNELYKNHFPSKSTHMRKFILSLARKIS
jgi:hypothetical protein